MALLSPPNYEACLLSAETISFESQYVDWAPALNGELHPALCESCTSKLSVGTALSIGHAPTTDLELSMDGIYLVSPHAKASIGILGAVKFQSIDGSGYSAIVVDSLPKIEIDEVGSELRHSDKCSECGDYRETLLGIDLATKPPSPKRLVYDAGSQEFGHTHCMFGAGFHRAGKLFFAEHVLADFRSHGLTGFDTFTAG